MKKQKNEEPNKGFVALIYAEKRRSEKTVFILRVIDGEKCMSNTQFKYLDKRDFENILPQMFEILHSNMSIIAPTKNSYETDFKIWISYFFPAIQEEFRETVLMYIDRELVGYFRYYLNDSMQSLLMEDIQIIPEFQGTGVFSSLYNWLVNKLPKNILTVEAYASKKNYKSRTVLEHLGLKCKGENKNGNSLYFKGDYSVLYNKYS